MDKILIDGSVASEYDKLPCECELLLLTFNFQTRLSCTMSGHLPATAMNGDSLSSSPVHTLTSACDIKY